MFINGDTLKSKWWNECLPSTRIVMITIGVMTNNFTKSIKTTYQQIHNNAHGGMDYHITAGLNKLVEYGMIKSFKKEEIPDEQTPYDEFSLNYDVDIECTEVLENFK